MLVNTILLQIVVVTLQGGRFGRIITVNHMYRQRWYKGLNFADRRADVGRLSSWFDLRSSSH